MKLREAVRVSLMDALLRYQYSAGNRMVQHAVREMRDEAATCETWLLLALIVYFIGWMWLFTVRSECCSMSLN